MEVINLKSSSGMAKAAGITLCLAGVLVIAFYSGPSLNPLSRHRVFADHGSKHAVSKGLWITWTSLMLLACIAWSLWIIFQGFLPCRSGPGEESSFEMEAWTEYHPDRGRILCTEL
ncbi:hypothetical protein ACP70R_034980 [Stipagrostis hirtigluma subsp. patula]